MTVEETVPEIIDLTDGEGASYGPDEKVRVSASGCLASTGTLLDQSGPSQLINHLVALPSLPQCPTYAEGVAPPRPKCGICKALGSNNLVLVWHVGDVSKRVPRVRLKFFELWMCSEPFEEWKKMGDIAALTPPMSCILSKLPYGVAHFSVRAIDFQGRFGPFAVPATCQRRSRSQKVAAVAATSTSGTNQ